MANAILHSTACEALRNSLMAECNDHGELKSLSIDATFKICFAILGQAKFNRHKRIRSKMAIKDEEAKYRVFTVRGMTSAVLAADLVHDESAVEVSANDVIVLKTTIN